VVGTSGVSGQTERAVAAFARSSNGGLIVAGSALESVQRNLIIGLATRHKLPAVYPERSLVAASGLVYYGANYVDQFRQAVGYVDRILKGEKPADLPVARSESARGLKIFPVLEVLPTLSASC
jgi:ABC-type uncharacterized transport system substrate-binding protein